MFDNYIKETTILFSTTSLEPPRPPTLFTSLILSDDEIAAGDRINASKQEKQSFSDNKEENELVTVQPEKTQSERIAMSSNNVTASNSTIQKVQFPSVKEILNGTFSSPSNNHLQLISINVIRNGKNTTDKYTSKTNRYFLEFSKKESGFLGFVLKGRGTKTVTVQSITVKNHIAKVMEAKGDFAAFPYKITRNTVEAETLKVKIANNFNDELYFYVKTTR